ncbi:uncharacterized protein LOC123317410 [Coccinella septempunctata]|uniref:uncharacterized protein LOC123317410 n=1 Tax=Coccinella septempunctata TaxID=41139 RepID=UPI001D08D844|nr:uncharacterized protein LOC123317410 [Coccinella septempunctata]
MKVTPVKNRNIALGMPLPYISNPQIMKIVNDSYGNLNRKFNPVQVSTTTNLLPLSLENCHYMLSGNKFVPVPMDISIEQPQMIRTFNNSTSFNAIKTHSTIHPSQSVVQRNKNSDNSTLLMPLPVPVQNKHENVSCTAGSSVQSVGNIESNKMLKNSQLSDDNNNKSKNYQVKTIFCTGTIERILRWNRNLEGVFCMYETIAPIVSLQEGRIKGQKIMLLRDKKGPILQVQYYTSTHIDIDDFNIGQYLRCVGRMIGFNILAAESIREAKEDEISSLARLSYVCDYSVTHNLNST